MIRSFLYTGSKDIDQDVPLDTIKQLLMEERGMLWIDLYQPTAEEFKILDETFGFHPLTIEDCKNLRHHPKIENYEDYLFLILHAPNGASTGTSIRTHELDIYLGPNYVVTHHAQTVASLDAVMKKCLSEPVKTLGRGSDYLLHMIVDILMESYDPMVEDLTEEIQWAEEEVFCNPDDKFLREVTGIKKNILYIRRIMARQRDTILRLSRADYPLISQELQIYFRDISDLLVRIMDALEGNRDLINSTIETYLIVDNNRLNQVMKGLTVMASVMLPLTVVTGIYGTNFKYMPEIDWKYGYIFFWGLMVFAAMGTLGLMRRNKWL